MIQTAKVIRILEDGRAEVSVQRQSACGHDCSKCGGGCAELAVLPTVVVKAENPVRAMAGDTVTVESSSHQVLKAAAVVYLVPFLLFFIGYFSGSAGGLGDGIAVIFGIVGFLLGLLCAVALDRHNRKSRGITFRITAIQGAGV